MPWEAALPVAMLYDADAVRAMLEILSMLTLPDEVLAGPGLGDRIMTAAEGRDAMVAPGPTRGDLLRMLA